MNRRAIGEWLGLFEGVAEPEQSRFRPVGSKKLKTNWQCGCRKTAGNIHPRNAGEVRRYCVDIVKVHGQRVVYLFANKKCWSRRSRRNDGIATLKGVLKILFDQRANLL